MAVSFVVRCRRQLAAIPFVIIVVVPLLLATFVWLDRRAVPAMKLESINAETACIETDALAVSAVEGCNFPMGISSTD